MLNGLKEGPQLVGGAMLQSRSLILFLLPVEADCDAKRVPVVKVDPNTGAALILLILMCVSFAFGG